jgi:hypothetical protein
MTAWRVVKRFGGRPNLSYFRGAHAPSRAVVGAPADHIPPQDLSAILFEKNRKQFLREPAICNTLSRKRSA